MNHSRTRLAEVSSSNALKRGMGRHDTTRIQASQKPAVLPQRSIGHSDCALSSRSNGAFLFFLCESIVPGRS